MGIQFKVIEISMSTEGYFIGIGPDKKKTTCYIHNKERDWNKIYDYLGKTITVKGSLMTKGNFIVMEIIE